MKNLCDFMFFSTYVLHSEDSSDINIGRPPKKYQDVFQTQKKRKVCKTPKISLKFANTEKRDFEHISKPSKIGRASLANFRVVTSGTNYLWRCSALMQLAKRFITSWIYEYFYMILPKRVLGRTRNHNSNLINVSNKVTNKARRSNCSA